MVIINLEKVDIQIIEDILLKSLEKDSFIKEAFGCNNEDLANKKHEICSILSDFCFPITCLEKEIVLKIEVKNI